jgi:hypothetical protein
MLKYRCNPTDPCWTPKYNIQIIFVLHNH